MIRRVALLTGLLVAIAVLIWLRDPSWLARMEYGFGAWEVDADGTRYRWTAGRASFFVPADASEVRVPLRVPVQPGDWPVIVSVALDGRPVDRLSIATDDWRASRLRLPPRGSRRFRRIDIHVDRTQGDRGVQVGEVQVAR
jgi:hypothetical protein